MLERTVRAERRAVLAAATRGAPAGGRRTTLAPDGGRPRRGVHGPYTHLPGAGGEAEDTARRFRRVQLSQGDRRLQFR